MFDSEEPSWRNPKVLTTLVMVFLVGALTGAISMRATFRPEPQRATAPYWRGAKDEFSYDRLRTQLDLTPDQSQRLKTILDDFVKYHDDLEEQIEDVRATGRNRIVQILTPQQRKRFEQLSKDLSKP